MKIFKGYRLGAVLATIILVMFFVVSWFFQDQNYYKTSLFINAYVLPPIFVFLTLMGMMYQKKLQKGIYTFKEGFRFAFPNQFLGGTFALVCIVFYLNVLDTDTRDVFNYQLYDALYQQQLKEFHEADVIELPGKTKEESIEIAKSVIDNLKDIRDNLSDNVFALNNAKLWALYLSMNAFYIFNSVFLSMFLKTPKSRDKHGE